LAEVVAVNIVVGGALSDAIIVIPEGTLAFGAVIGHVETL
jgi:hypothetical protein